ncbi:MAG: universal stress protein [Chloroflexi bacterium]|nr:universal stress protein [Chloroflexota bacterium]
MTASYKHLLVPFDGTPLAHTAGKLAAALTQRSHGSIKLIQVAPDADHLGLAEGAVQIEAAGLRERGVPAYGIALEGQPADALLAYVRHHRVDLVVMGTHGRSLPGRLLLGSVAYEVARRSPIPVMLVPAKAAWPPDRRLRVLVALDESPLADASLCAAVALWASAPVSLTLFQVRPGEPPPAVWKTPEWYKRSVLNVTSLEDAQARLERHGIPSERAYAFGDPAPEILDFAARGKFDMVVLGTHGRTGLDRWAFGSVAEGVVQGSAVPVLVSSSEGTCGI